MLLLMRIVLILTVLTVDQVRQDVLLEIPREVDLCAYAREEEGEENAFCEEQTPAANVRKPGALRKRATRTDRYRGLLLPVRRWLQLRLCRLGPRVPCVDERCCC